MSGPINPRYACYARAHGASSHEEMLEKDAARFPGGPMVGFIFWIGDRRAEWKRETRWDGLGLSDEDHASFDRWLESRHPAPFVSPTPVSETKAA